MSDVEDLPEFEQLKNAYINSKRGKDKAQKTFNGYKYSIGRFERFLSDCGLHYTDIDRETDLAPDFDSIDTSEYSDNNLLDYFVLWLINEEGYAKSTTQTTFNYVQPFVRFLRNEGYVEYNVLEHTDLSEYLTYGTTLQQEEWGDDYRYFPNVAS
ncbi:hypothetical protein [Halopiger thermotolerans]